MNISYIKKLFIFLFLIKMGPTNLKELCKLFYRGYISEGHTVSLESEKEVSHLTNKWFEGFDVEDFYFTSEQLIDYLDYPLSMLNCL